MGRKKFDITLGLLKHEIGQLDFFNLYVLGEPKTPPIADGIKKRNIVIRELKNAMKVLEAKNNE